MSAPLQRPPGESRLGPNDLPEHVGSILDRIFARLGNQPPGAEEPHRVPDYLATIARAWLRDVERRPIRLVEFYDTLGRNRYPADIERIDAEVEKVLRDTSIDFSGSLKTLLADVHAGRWASVGSRSDGGRRHD